MKIASNRPFYQGSFIILFLTLFLVACSGQQVSIEEPVLDAGFPFRQKWTYQADRPISTLASNDDSVVVTTGEKIIAVSSSDGHLLWEFEFKVDTLAPCLLTNKKIVVAANRQEIIAINAKDGHLLWKVGTPDKADQGFQLDAISENYLVVEKSTLWDIRVYDVTTGNFLWDTLGNRGGSGVYIDEQHNLLILVGGSISPRIFNLKTGKLNSQREGYTTEYSAYDFPSVYYISQDNKGKLFLVNSLDVTTMKKLWTLDLHKTGLGEALFAITSAKNMLWVSGEGGLYALDKNGDQLWTADNLGEGFNDRAVKSGKYIFAQGRATSKIYAWFDDGSLAGTISFPTKNFFERLIDNTNIFSVNNLLLLMNNDMLYAYGE